MMDIQVRERPILFSAPMVRAILEGRKVQTRRVVKWPVRINNACFYNAQSYDHAEKCGMGRDVLSNIANLCPYGNIGDRLWVREALCAVDDTPLPDEERGPYASYAECGSHIWPLRSSYRAKWQWKARTLPAMFMPRWASRLTLEITDVRVERLQDISARDALAEGVMPNACDFPDPIDDFRTLWDSIHGDKPGKCWESNCWVWVLKFEVLPQVLAGVKQ